MTTHLRTDLGAAVAAFAAGDIDPAAFVDAFNDCTVYAVRLPGRPMLAAVDVRGRLEAPIFSSLAALARWHVACAEPASPLAPLDWYAMTGGDLLSIWPAGCDLVIDPGSPHPVRYPSAALTPVGDLTITTREPGAR